MCEAAFGPVRIFSDWDIAMNSKRAVLVGALVFVGGITTLHWYFNIRGMGDTQLSTKFRVGFLPVT
jgi:hypothetical protein